MMEPHTAYYQASRQQQIKVFNKMFKSDLRSQCKTGHSPAFQSLSFRGNKGYSDNLITRPRNKKSVRVEGNVSSVRTCTYGAILCVKPKTESGKMKYALVQGRYTGKWSFPKGHSNEGELPIECALREVGEETGIDKLPDPVEYIQVGYGNYYMFNLDELLPLIPRDTNEIMDTKWVTLEEMEKMSLNADASLYRKQLSSLV